VDSLTNFETVKYFCNEQFEEDRFVSAVIDFQKANYTSQTSLTTLNLGQSLIITITTVVVLILAAFHVKNGSQDVAYFVVLNIYVAQVFSPLSWLGSLYSMIIDAWTGVSNLSDLLNREKPDVVDAPNAPELMVGAVAVLPDECRCVCVCVCDGVCVRVSAPAPRQ
jgi:ABC-type transport system involved in Fe-S cluster assembly fused permease/ATPase subunit